MTNIIGLPKAVATLINSVPVTTIKLNGQPITLNFGFVKLAGT